MARAFILAPLLSSPFLWLGLITWQGIRTGSFEMSSALEWGVLTLLVGLPLAYLAMGILGTLAYRVLVKLGAADLVGFACAGSLIGGAVGAATFPFLDPRGFALIGLVTGCANGVLVHVLAERWRKRLPN